MGLSSPILYVQLPLLSFEGVQTSYGDIQKVHSILMQVYKSLVSFDNMKIQLWIHGNLDLACKSLFFFWAWLAVVELYFTALDFFNWLDESRLFFACNSDIGTKYWTPSWKKWALCCEAERVKYRCLLIKTIYIHCVCLDEACSREHTTCLFQTELTIVLM